MSRLTVVVVVAIVVAWHTLAVAWAFHMGDTSERYKMAITVLLVDTVLSGVALEIYGDSHREGKSDG